MKKILLSAVLFASSFTTVAQVGIGTTTPKGALHVTSTTSGVIIPQFANLTAIQAIKKADGTTDLNTDEQGMQVYNIAEKKTYMWDGTKWSELAAKGSGDNDAGNAGIGSAYGEVASTTGKVWLDRNLGATSNDPANTNSYGDLYQWGRSADGHQLRTSNATPGQLSDWIADESEDVFRTGSSDWLSTANDNLWTGTAAENNPCPSGFRLPTNAELNQERIALNITNAASAASSLLKLPVAGYRDYSNGTLGNVGSNGDYWSSTVSGTNARFLDFSSSNADMGSLDRAHGLSIRCIKD
jgi:uncharacterized protein (TIGR02145 family)